MEFAQARSFNKWPTLTLRPEHDRHAGLTEAERETAVREQQARYGLPHWRDRDNLSWSLSRDAQHLVAAGE